MPAVVQLVTVGKAARALLGDLVEPLRQEFGVEALIGKPMAEPKYAFNKDRKQYHSTAILRRLGAMLATGQIGVLGVAEVDLFVPDAEFVFGEADRQSRTAVVSLARLRPGALNNNDLLRARLRREASHCVGHLVGLSHCDDPRCLMFLSAVVEDTDRKGAALCHDCRAELGRQAVTEK